MGKNKKKKKGKERKRPSLNLSPDTQKSIFGVFSIFIAIFFILSLSGHGGKIGDGLNKVLGLFFGKGSWVIIILFFLVGIVFLTSEHPSPYLSTIVGGILFLISVFSIMELFQEELGGYLGQVLTSLPKGLIGPVGSWIFFLCLFLISLSLLFNTPIIKIRRAKEKLPGEKARLREGEVDLKVKEIPPAKGIKQKFRIATPKIIKKKKRAIKYKSLPLALLDQEENNAIAGNLRVNAQIIKKTLRTFGINVEMGEINIGPTVTQYTLKPAEGVQIARILARRQDLALTLAAHPIRIEAPIPGRSLVGIEVPNQKRAEVRLKSLLSSPDFLSLPSLSFPIGKDVKGNPHFTDLGSMPHLLVAGATGKGKTVFLNSLILSLLWKNSPQDLRLILIDPKRVEFTLYKSLPHLLCPPVLSHSKVIPVLKWLIGEMERRFELLHQSGAQNIEIYNQEQKKRLKEEEKKKREVSQADEQNNNPLPYIIYIVDELNDIMVAKGREFEAGIVRLAQMSRAVGVHLVLATQRPEVSVLTGLIKANITSRIAFQVGSQVDSRTILDTGGAEHLLDKGDMLYLSSEAGKPRRFQSALVLRKEVKRVVDYIQKTEKRIELEEEGSLHESLDKVSEGKTEFLEFGEGDEELYEEAKRVVIRARKASASLLQRRLKIGYARAARILDMLEERGVVGPSKGSKPRDVYISNEENDEELNNL